MSRSRRATMLLCCCLGPLGIGAAQGAERVRDAPDSVTLAAGGDNGIPRWLLGGAYHDLWAKPIRVPVLDLATFDGGLVPEQAADTLAQSLHLRAADGSEYVFRALAKDDAEIPEELRDVKFAVAIARDMASSSHPAASLIHTPFFRAVGVLHDDDPLLIYMPDDPRLGEFREEFAGRLGVLTRFPGGSRELATEYAGAREIIDSDTLLRRLNRDPRNRVDPGRYLASRLVEMLLNNYDRRPGNWKWARLEAGAAWQPVSRDMDKVLISHDGVLPALFMPANATRLTFDSGYPDIGALTAHSLQLDRRILSGTSRAVFDSVAVAVRDRITDRIIAAGMAMMPPEYRPSQPEIVAKLRMRRDSIPAIAERFYLHLARVVDIHGTDAAEHAAITRVDSRWVDVRIAGPDGRPYYSRRFDARETEEIRVYLHGGDDQATVLGTVSSSIPLHIVGGNGTNRLRDASRVGGRDHAARLYDVGPTDEVEYGADTFFNRRPLVEVGGVLVVPGQDHGRGGGPTFGVSTSRDMGLMPRLRKTWQWYGFRMAPYAREVILDGRYSFKQEGVAVSLRADQRLAGSRLHFTALARMSQLELLNYHGLGGSSPRGSELSVGAPGPTADFYSVQQDRWMLHPAVAYALGPRTDLRLGPVVEYTISNGSPGGFLERTAPYGSGRFGAAGLRASLRHDTRNRSRHPERGAIVEVQADMFPAMWDVRSAFSSLSAMGGVYFTIPLPLRPYLGLRVIGQRVFGDFPFHEAAFIGGRAGSRSLDTRRFGGDASLTARADLRVPLVKFNVLLPLDVGLFAAHEAGRVYLDGESPEGWHNSFGAGFWVGFREIQMSVHLIEVDQVGRPVGPGLRVSRGLERR